MHCVSDMSDNCVTSVKGKLMKPLSFNVGLFLHFFSPMKGEKDL